MDSYIIDTINDIGSIVKPDVFLREIKRWIPKEPSFEDIDSIKEHCLKNYILVNGLGVPSGDTYSRIPRNTFLICDTGLKICNKGVKNLQFLFKNINNEWNLIYVATLPRIYQKFFIPLAKQSDSTITLYQSRFIARQPNLCGEGYSELQKEKTPELYTISNILKEFGYKYTGLRIGLSNILSSLQTSVLLPNVSESIKKEVIKRIFITYISLKSENTFISKGYIKSSKFNFNLLNTGLLNRFYQPIYVIDFTPDINACQSKIFKIVESSAEFEVFDFDIEDLPEPFKPLEDAEDYITNFKKQKVLVDYSSLSHIVTSHRERFSKNLSSLSESTIANMLNSAIEISRNLSELNRNFAKPAFSIKRQAICYILPISFEGFRFERPEYFIVLEKHPLEDAWKVATLKTHSMVNIEVTALQPYCTSWS